MKEYIKSLDQFLMESRNASEIDVEEIVDDINSTITYSSASLSDSKSGRVVSISLGKDSTKERKIIDRIISRYPQKLKLDKNQSSENVLIYQIIAD